jgi:hypothetical protein
MARRPVDKSIKKKTESLYRKCKYCLAHRDARGFDKHLAACKHRFDIQNESHTINGHAQADDLMDDNFGHTAPVLPETDQHIPDLALLADNSNRDPEGSGPTFIPQPSVLQSKLSAYSETSAHILFQLAMGLSFPRNT